MSNPYDVVRQFERALCEYTGATFAVTTTSCTMALLLALAYIKRDAPPDWLNTIAIPKRTYVGVAMSIRNAGFKVTFEDYEWKGSYRLYPTNIYDCARRFTSGMHREGNIDCVSFHWSKILAIGQGGAILHDDAEMDGWLRRARFDGRSEGVPAEKDEPCDLGYHAYMMPRDAAEGLSKLCVLPKDNADLPNSDYPDLSTFRIFR